MVMLAVTRWPKQFGLWKSKDGEIDWSSAVQLRFGSQRFLFISKRESNLFGQRFPSHEEAVDAFRMHVLEIPQSEWKSVIRAQKQYSFQIDTAAGHSAAAGSTFAGHQSRFCRAEVVRVGAERANETKIPGRFASAGALSGSRVARAARAPVTVLSQARYTAKFKRPTEVLLFVHSRFQSGNFDVKDEYFPGQPVIDKVDAVLEKVEQDRHIRSYDIPEELEIDHKTVLIRLE
ncbi:hypothetical protein EVAR_32810_1 [Eumeta japonica]|uniref:Uncharacterized protein n=1 Tax=Eumeta variegata TaxID=151549 RepID=A0A4C1WBM8_EUMVA|nr:hypothetical protein EVAR_32810_1 [Eumeta japonica]